MPEESRHTIRRRSAMKTIAGAAVLAPALSKSPTVEATYRAPYKSTHDASVIVIEPYGTIYNDYDRVSQDTGVGLEWVDSFYTSSDGGEEGDNVMHEFIGSGCATILGRRTSDGEWETVEDNSISDLYLELQNNDISNGTLIAPGAGDRRLIAATQSDGDVLNWEDGMTELFEAVVTNMSPHASAVVDADSVVQEFKNDEDEGEEEANHAEYAWDYGSAWPGGGNGEDNPGATINFFVHSDSETDGFDVTVRTDMSRIHSIDGEDEEGDDTYYIGQRIYTDGVSINTYSEEDEVVPNSEIDNPILKEFADGDDLKKVHYNVESEEIDFNPNARPADRNRGRGNR